MFQWLARWLRLQVRTALEEHGVQRNGKTTERNESEGQLDETVASLRADVGEVLETLRKSARAQTRVGVRLDEMARKLEAPDSIRTQDAGPDERWIPLWDAMDLLDQAIQSIDGGQHPEIRTGLSGVLSRLERFVSSTGVERGVAKGDRPDGRLVRVVGTEDSGEFSEGAVIRVVRAPVRVGDRVLREGEVITCRRVP